jgi:hypothetical protein
VKKKEVKFCMLTHLINLSLIGISPGNLTELEECQLREYQKIIMLQVIKTKEKIENSGSVEELFGKDKDLFLNSKISYHQQLFKLLQLKCDKNISNETFQEILKSINRI